LLRQRESRAIQDWEGPTAVERAAANRPAPHAPSVSHRRMQLPVREATSVSQAAAPVGLLAEAAATMLGRRPRSAAAATVARRSAVPAAAPACPQASLVVEEAFPANPEPATASRKPDQHRSADRRTPGRSPEALRIPPQVWPAWQQARKPHQRWCP
jgi:hypothetical protein